MANLELQIQEFLKINTNSGYGYGCGYGSDYGYGDGSGFGFGSDSGDGYECSDDSDYGYGYGCGYGCGYDSGDGYGSGDGSGDGISKINNLNVYRIDDVATIITNVKGNVAKGFILKADLTLEPCFIAKGNNMFAHGNTLKNAISSLQDKIFSELDTEERIDEFRKMFKNGVKYKGTDFYKWHHILTGSCEMGRTSFVENNGLSLEDEYTVLDFINLTKNSYGGGIIKKLEKYYGEKENGN